MGRIKTMLIKRISEDLFRQYGDKFSQTFEENKPIVEQYVDFPSKKIRNIVAGYVTRLVKTKEEL